MRVPRTSLVLRSVASAVAASTLLLAAMPAAADTPSRKPGDPAPQIRWALVSRDQPAQPTIVTIRAGVAHATRIRLCVDGSCTKYVMEHRRSSRTRVATTTFMVPERATTVRVQVAANDRGKKVTRREVAAERIRPCSTAPGTRIPCA